jgi:hypothetical protein
MPGWMISQDRQITTNMAAKMIAQKIVLRYCQSCQ